MWKGRAPGRWAIVLLDVAAAILVVAFCLLVLALIWTALSGGGSGGAGHPDSYQWPDPPLG